MAESTTIEWTDSTWNPVRGCALVSPGCTNCYAMKVAHRFSGKGEAYAGLTKLTKGGPVWTGQVRELPELLERPLKWKHPRRIFVNSMSDLFHEDVHGDFIDAVLDTVRAAPRHTFQILTKRAARMQAFMRHYKPIPNLWLGVSVEDQARADERIPLLLQTPAAVRWISAEPLLGPIDLRDPPNDMGEPRFSYLERIDGTGPRIDWIVAGGESGPGARPMHPDWVRSLRDQCGASSVPFFFKQWGAWALPIPEDGVPPGACDGRLYLVGKKAAGRHLDGRTHDEYPA